MAMGQKDANPLGKTTGFGVVFFLLPNRFFLGVPGIFDSQPNGKNRSLHEAGPAPDAAMSALRSHLRKEWGRWAVGRAHRWSFFFNFFK